MKKEHKKRLSQSDLCVAGLTPDLVTRRIRRTKVEFTKFVRGIASAGASNANERKVEGRAKRRSS